MIGLHGGCTVGFDVVSGAIYPLLIRDYLPLEHRLNALYSRVKGLGKVLEDSLRNVDEPYSLWIDYVLMMTKGLSGLLDMVKGFGEKHGFSELREACDKAKMP